MKTKAVIVEREYLKEDIGKKLGSMYRVEHPKPENKNTSNTEEENICKEKPLDVDEIINKATSRIGKEGWSDDKNGYNFFKNNCEHIANWCVEGEAKCDQTETLKKVITEEIKKASSLFMMPICSKISEKIPSEWFQKHIPKYLNGLLSWMSVIILEVFRVRKDILEARDKYKNGYFTQEELIKLILVSIACAVTRLAAPVLVDIAFTAAPAAVTKILGFILHTLASYILQAVVTQCMKCFISITSWLASRGISTISNMASFVTSVISNISSHLGKMCKQIPFLSSFF